MIIRKFLFLIFLLLIISCNYDLKYYKDIIGQWQCVTVENRLPSGDCSGEIFQFNDDHIFTQIDGANLLNGSYKIDGNKLHRAMPGSPVISVRIKDIVGDTMWWESLDEPKSIMILAKT